MKSVKQAKTLGRGIVVSVMYLYATCSGGLATNHSDGSPIVTHGTPRGDRSLITWFELLQFVAQAVCDVVSCEAQTAGDRSNTQEQAEMIVRGVIDAYSTHGVAQGLTPNQAASGIVTVNAALWLLDDPASLLAPETSDQFRATLIAIRSDLEGVASGRATH